MSDFSFIVNVMFAVYVINFLSSFFKSFTEKWNFSAKIWLDLIWGILLFIAVVIAN